MAVRLRLARTGKKKQPHYRVVAADARVPRDGRFLEILGWYDPRSEPSSFQIDLAAVRKWLDRGATPSERVAKLLALADSPALGVAAPSVSVPEDVTAAQADQSIDEAPTSEGPAAEAAVDEAPMAEEEAGAVAAPGNADLESPSDESSLGAESSLEASAVTEGVETEEAE